ncbi:unnamed protein product [Toxocara canis]|uniref:MADF domain-containing protein n=1 Tax=Toxocara canis TaxID=6265 RepID=A0A183V2B8_TOXCA|nr:unnamed protein product [Toxocara canis]
MYLCERPALLQHLNIDWHPVLEKPRRHAMDALERHTMSSRLIDAVRSCPCLYDTRDPMYRNFQHRTSEWSWLVQSLQFHGKLSYVLSLLRGLLIWRNCNKAFPAFFCSGDAVTLQKLWKQLRDKYGKEKNRAKCTLVESQWQFFKQLQFLDPFMTDRQGRRNAICGNGALLRADVLQNVDKVDITDAHFAKSLVDQVHQHPCLYDIRNSKYLYTERKKAWQEIIGSLNFPGDVDSIRKEWKKLRDRYVRERRRILFSAADAKRSQWYMYPQMAWIDPFLDYIMELRKRKYDSGQLSEEEYVNGFDAAAGNGSAQCKVASLRPHFSPNIPAGQRNTAPDSHRGVGSELESILAEQLKKKEDILLQEHGARTIDGDKAFALSVLADLQALPEHARPVVRMQIQNWLDSSMSRP